MKRSTMKCPICHSHSLTDVNLDTGLLAGQCHQCFGHWISSVSYWEWLDFWEQNAKAQASSQSFLSINKVGVADSEYELNSGLFEGSFRPVKNHTYIQQRHKVSSLLPVTDNTTANFCADCDRLMTKAKVGRGLSFYLDRCSHCHGVWLDRHEWENLRRMELHRQIHYVFSSAWQFSLRKGQAVQKNHAPQKTPA